MDLSHIGVLSGKLELVMVPYRKRAESAHNVIIHGTDFELLE